MEPINKLIELFGLVVVTIHIPIVGLLVFISYRVYKSLHKKAFKYIAIAWAIQLIHVSLSFLKRGQITFVNPEDLTMNIGVLFADFLSSALFLFGALVGAKLYHSLTKFIKTHLPQVASILIIVITIIICYFYFEIDKKIIDWPIKPISIMFSIFGVFALWKLAIYFSKEFAGFDSNRLLYFGTLFYGILQIAAIINIDKVEFEFLSEMQLVLGYSFSLIFKVLILIGLQNILIQFAKKQADVDLANIALNKILGRTFHEITGPLRTIHNRIVKLTIADSMDYKLTKSTKDELSIIESNQNRLIAVVGASIKMYEDAFGEHKFDGDFFKIPNQKLSPNNINTLIEIAIITIKDFIKDEESISFTKIYGGECNIICYSYEVVQIIFNIIKNSYDSFEEGTGSIFIRTNVAKSYDESNELIRIVRVEIADNGPGIDPEILKKVTEEGFTTKEIKNRGYGLSISKELVKKNKGSIHFKSPYEFSKFNSNITSGTLVTLSFPAITVNNR